MSFLHIKVIDFIKKNNIVIYIPYNDFAIVPMRISNKYIIFNDHKIDIELGFIEFIDIVKAFKSKNESLFNILKEHYPEYFI